MVKKRRYFHYFLLISPFYCFFYAGVNSPPFTLRYSPSLMVTYVVCPSSVVASLLIMLSNSIEESEERSMYPVIEDVCVNLYSPAGMSVPTL